MVSFEQKESYNIEDLIEIVGLLRSEGGCPWDKEQTHESIRSDFIEEVYEAIEAIDLKDTALLREELGDVLLQVVFHCQIEHEQEHFAFEDICDELCKSIRPAGQQGRKERPHQSRGGHGGLLADGLLPTGAGQYAGVRYHLW